MEVEKPKSWIQGTDWVPALPCATFMPLIVGVAARVAARWGSLGSKCVGRSPDRGSQAECHKG